VPLIVFVQLEPDSPDRTVDENRKDHVLLTEPQSRMFLDRLPIAGA
jgi:hypothetical protein